jgi:hypothetical protein
LLLGLIGVYLIYINQSSTLWYSLRESLSDVQDTEEQVTLLQLQVGKIEQQLWSRVERVSNKNEIKKIVVE